MEKIFPKSGMRKWDFDDPETGEPIFAVAWPFVEKRDFYRLIIQLDSKDGWVSRLSLRYTQEGELGSCCHFNIQYKGEEWMASSKNSSTLVPHGDPIVLEENLLRVEALMEAMKDGRKVAVSEDQYLGPGIEM